MIRINKINNQEYKKPLITAKNTGYAAAGALLLTSVRSVMDYKPVRKTHKFLGYLTMGLTLFHLAVVEYYHRKYKKM